MKEFRPGDSIEIRMPFEGHVHFRQNRSPFASADGKPTKVMDLMDIVVPFTAAHFWGGVPMTNTRPPATTPAMVRQYKHDIRESAKKAGYTFHPIGVLFLTKDTKPEDVDDDEVDAVKFMPEGGTTNAMSGLPSLKPIYPVMEACQQLGKRVLLHGEVPDPDEPADTLEALFIARELEPLLRNFPKLMVCLEHATTEAAVEFVKKRAKDYTIRASLTPQHLHETIYSLVRKNGKNGLWREKYCLPVYKDSRDCGKLRSAAILEPELFYAGTDSAPHLESAKEARGCCAGAFSAPAAMAMYAKLFELSREDMAKNLERFASVTGPEFFGLKPSDRKMRLIREDWTMPTSIPVHVRSADYGVISEGDQQQIVPYKYGETLSWKATGE